MNGIGARTRSIAASRRRRICERVFGAVLMARRTVLVVDDEPRIAAIASDYLRHAGYAVVTAGDGARALQLARAQPPDLIVLDLGLPGTDGLDVARTLRTESNVPIIMLTARVEESDRTPWPRDRRGRLHGQAVQPARAGRAGQSRPAANGASTVGRRRRRGDSAILCLTRHGSASRAVACRSS